MQPHFGRKFGAQTKRLFLDSRNISWSRYNRGRKMNSHRNEIIKDGMENPI
jgi:hypothetical protein